MVFVGCCSNSSFAIASDKMTFGWNFDYTNVTNS